MSTPTLPSEQVVISAPMSLAGSAQRIWRIRQSASQTAGRVVLGTIAVALIVCAWTVILAWYLFFGLLLVPYRVLRRGSRKRHRQALQHRELMAAVQPVGPEHPRSQGSRHAA